MYKALAILLSILFFTANIEHWSEVFQAHEHQTCESAKHHLHNEGFDCEHNDFFFVTRVFLPSHSEVNIFAPYFRKDNDFSFSNPHTSFEQTLNPLRGPPVLC